MKKTISLFLLLISFCIFGQDVKFTDAEIQHKLDSIKAEGNLLFSMENASWHSTDLAQENKKIKGKFGGYLTYKTNDTVKTVFLNKDQHLIIAEYFFKNDLRKPVKENFKQRNLNLIEISLNNVRAKLISQLSDPKYEVGVPEGFNLNIVTIPFNENFKNYIITGATQNNIIPFGNDYLFITDKEGNITSNKKFHSRLILTMSAMQDGSTITESTHSHLRTNPFISATDICTFRLYASFTKMEEFSVYSPALGCYMKYNYKKDTITSKSKDSK